MQYIVNKQTREHRVYDPSSLEDVLLAEFDSNWRLLRADENGWIEWGGGECPLPDALPPGQSFECVERCGRKSLPLSYPGIHANSWMHKNGDKDIVAYRPACYHEQHNDEPTAEEEEAFRMIKDKQPEWDGEGLPPVGAKVSYAYVRSRTDCNGECVILGYDGNQVWFKPRCAKHVTMDARAVTFRPLRTAAQRAEDALMDAYVEGAKGHCGGIKAIYTAIREGRIPGVKLEGGR